jgi:hypothetical protein
MPEPPPVPRSELAELADGQAPAGELESGLAADLHADLGARRDPEGAATP